KELLRLFRSDMRPGLLLHRPKHREPLFIGRGIKQGNVLFSPALALEVHGEQVRTAGEQKPNDLAAQLRVSHELGYLGKDAVAYATVAEARSIAKLRIRFVDHHGNWTHRL